MVWSAVTNICNCTFSLNAEVTISGLELESRYYPSESLSLNATIGILDADYDSYDDGGVISPT